MLPMHKTEALWLCFSAWCPMALKVGAGGVCAVSGQQWSAGLAGSVQNYVVLPEQLWLDGFRVTEDVIRQFVAVPMGKGLTVEKQITGKEAWGGLQLQAFPMKLDELWDRVVKDSLEGQWTQLLAWGQSFGRICETIASSGGKCAIVREQGLGAGGRMTQKITVDPHGVKVWNTRNSSRCYVRLCLADDWQRLTGQPPPHQPPSAQTYTAAGLPWFDYQDNMPAVVGETALATVKSVNTLVDEKVGLGLSGNSSVTPENLITIAQKHATVVP